MRSKHFFLFIGLILCYGCQDGKNNQAFIGEESRSDMTTLLIDFKDAVQIDVSITDMEEIDLVFPDTVSVYGPIDLHARSDGGYVIYDRGRNSVYLTDTNRFLQEVGAIGRGPGEYEQIVDFSLGSEDTLMLLVNNGTKILVYSPEAVFQREISLQQSNKSFISHQNRIWTRAIEPDDEGNHFLRIYDNGDESKFTIPTPFISIPVQESNFSLVRGQDVYYKESFNHCVHHISSMQVYPVYCLDFGEFAYDRLTDATDDIAKYMALSQKGNVRILQYQEVSNHEDAFVLGIDKQESDEYFILIYDASSGSQTLFEVDTDLWGVPVFHTIQGFSVFLKMQESERSMLHLNLVPLSEIVTQDSH